jgi:hypothetical protein
MKFLKTFTRLLLVSLILIALIVPIGLNTIPVMATAPTVLDFQVSASTDDCYVDWENPVWYCTLDGLNVGEGYGTSATYKKGGGLRFQGITIPVGATITNAYISVRSYNNSSLNSVNTYITGNKENNPSAFSTIADYQTRRGTVVGGANDTKITTTQVAWDNIGSWITGTWYNSPDISTVIQELVTAHAPTNEAIALFLDDHNDRSTHTNGTQRVFDTYDLSGNVSGAKLHIEYVVVPTITAEEVSNITYRQAQLNANVDSDGGNTTQVRFGYGATSQNSTSFESYTTKTAWVDGYNTGDAANVTASNLTPETIYYYRSQAKNVAGNSTSLNEEFFTSSSYTQLQSWSLTDYSSNLTIPSQPSEMYDESGPKFPGGTLPDEVSDAGGVPRSVFWTIIPLIILCLIGVAIFQVTHSLVAQAAVIGIVMVVVCTLLLHVWPLYLIVPYVLDVSAICLAGKVYGY